MKTENGKEYLTIEEFRKTALPCPFCGGTDLSFEFSMSYGHGDCGFNNARIMCNSCTGSKGDGYDYGRPSDDDEVNAYVKWNERFPIVK